MRAVNLIPADDRRGAGGAAGRSGGAAYILLGGLALLVVLAAAYVLAGKSVTDRKAELTDITRQAEVAERTSSSLSDYTRFAALRTKRVQTVTQLADSRFPWAHALREVARVLPENAWLTSLTGTTAPSVSINGSSSALRSALPVPAISVTGCTTSQGSVAKMMARMRLIDGVARVSLETSEKGAAATAQAGATVEGASSDSGDCRGGSAAFPQFSMIVFFEETTAVAVNATAASTSVPASTATPSTPTPATPAAGGTTP